MDNATAPRRQTESRAELFSVIDAGLAILENAKMILLPKPKSWRGIIVLAGFALLVALFYAEENWRGKRAWENCKRQLEAKGETLDWNAYIPPDVADYQNFFKAPRMTELFVKPPSKELTNDFVIRLSNASTTSTITNETAAINYLAWSDRFKPDFDSIRNALKRPYARMDGDYSDPTIMPIPNFVSIRILTQTLAQRAKGYLILHQPEKALNELTLLNDSRRMLEAAPLGKPMTLVAAMINVAVIGIYVDAISTGLQSKAWQEPQLISFQKQLAQINLIQPLVEAQKTEPVWLCYWIEMNQQSKVFGSVKEKYKILGLSWPRGWIYQSMANIVKLDRMPLQGFDLTNNTVSPRVLDEAARYTDDFSNKKLPYESFAANAALNIWKARQTTAYNQTLVNEAQIACALERYRLAHGEYPETLDALAPQFIEKIPHDIIGGQPLHYRRTDDGKFLLYSVGWNEKDDGGVTETLSDVKNGDWVWKN